MEPGGEHSIGQTGQKYVTLLANLGDSWYYPKLRQVISFSQIGKSCLPILPSHPNFTLRTLVCKPTVVSAS
jgi:hypothetical protein